MLWVSNQWLSNDFHDNFVLKNQICRMYFIKTITVLELISDKLQRLKSGPPKKINLSNKLIF